MKMIGYDPFMHQFIYELSENEVRLSIKYAERSYKRFLILKLVRILKREL